MHKAVKKMLKRFVIFVGFCSSINYVSCEGYPTYSRYQFTVSATNPKKVIGIQETGRWCPAEKAKDISKVNAQSELPGNFRLKYCLFKKINEDGSPIPNTCETEIKPVLVPQTDTNREQIRCESDSNAEQYYYLVGFYLCGDENELRKFYRDSTSHNPEETRLQINVDGIYHVCYDKQTNQTIWTRHTIVTPLLFDEMILEDDNLNDIDINTDSFDLKDTYFRIRKHEYESEKHKNLPRGMVPYPLVPYQHIALPVSKTATYHIMNMAPLWRNLIDLMFAIDYGLKKAQLNLYRRHIEDYDMLEIYTKVESINKTLDTATTNSPIKKINSNTRSGLRRRVVDPVKKPTSPSPNIWYKFVYWKRKRIGALIRIHNNPDAIPEKQCVGVQLRCTFAQWIKGVKKATPIRDDDKVLWYAYCCQTSNEEIQKLFAVDVKLDDVLNLDRLVLLKKPREPDDPL